MCGLLASSNGCPDKRERLFARAPNAQLSMWACLQARAAANYVRPTTESLFRMYLLWGEYPLLLKLCTCK